MSEYGQFTFVFDGNENKCYGALTGRPVVLLETAQLELFGAQLEPGASIEWGNYVLTLVGPAANGGGLWEVRVAEKPEEEEE